MTRSASWFYDQNAAVVEVDGECLAGVGRRLRDPAAKKSRHVAVSCARVRLDGHDLRVGERDSERRPERQRRSHTVRTVLVLCSKEKGYLVVQADLRDFAARQGGHVGVLPHVTNASADPCPSVVRGTALTSVRCAAVSASLSPSLPKAHLPGKDASSPAVGGGGCPFEPGRVRDDLALRARWKSTEKRHDLPFVGHRLRNFVPGERYPFEKGTRLLSPRVQGGHLEVRVRVRQHPEV